MNYLLDTQIVIWSMREPGKINAKIRGILTGKKNRLFISTASLWEMSIKISLGKLDLAHSFIDHIYAADVSILTIEPTHIFTLLNLPHHHKDPFDRMLIAQALHENLTILTSDRMFKQYDAKIIRA